MSLDPKDWKAFRKSAHALLDASLDKLEASREGPVWQPVTKALAKSIREPLPAKPMDYAQIAETLEKIMPYGQYSSPFFRVGKRSGGAVEYFG